MITKKDLGERIAKNIRLIMLDKGLTQVEVANNMGHTRAAVNSVISSIKQGRGTFKTVCKYANALGVSPDDLLLENKLVPREPKTGKTELVKKPKGKKKEV